MSEEIRPRPNTRDRPQPAIPRPTEPSETREDPAPGVKHEPEPDAGNIMPAEDEPGTF